MISAQAFMGVIAPNLAASGAVGSEIPKYARGVANGLSSWASIIKVITVDGGSAGVGSNVPLPLTVPSPLLYGNLVSGMGAQGLTGVFVPSLMLGLANGMSACFAQTQIKTTHPSVGTGSGVAKLVFPPPTPLFIIGFQQAGLTGESLPRMSTALGLALSATLASLVIPIVIVGSASTSPAAGTGLGSLI